MSEAPITDIESWLQALMHPAAVTELVALAASAVLAWLLAWLLGRRTIQVDRQSLLFGERIIDGVLFPILLLCLSLTARAIVAQMRDDELRHADAARSAGAAVLPAPVQAAMRAMAKVMTTVAQRV